MKRDITNLEKLSTYEARKMYNEAWDTNYGNENEIIVKLEYIWSKKGRLEEIIKPFPKREPQLNSWTKPRYKKAKPRKHYNHLGRAIDVNSWKTPNSQLEEKENNWCAENYESFAK